MGWSYFRDFIEQQRCVIAEKCRFGQFGIPLRLECMYNQEYDIPPGYSDYPAGLNYIIALIFCILIMYVIWRYLEDGEILFRISL